MILLETLTTAYSTTTCLADDSDSLYTAVTTAITSSLGNPNINVQIQAANDYIDSLSVEELAEFDEMLAQHENQFDLGNGQKAVIPKVEKTMKKTYKRI